MQAKLTPLMQQYWEIKNQHTDKVVLFRMGDFYEMFHDDAETAAPILNIALTQRNKKAADSTKMCGVPHHSIAGPIAKLLAAGKKVAMADQIEDPALAKGIVKRAVTRVLTPGMVYDPDTLDQLSANYLASYDNHQLSFVDITTGEAFCYEVNDPTEREELLAMLSPAELVLPAGRWADRRKQNTISHGVVSEFGGEKAGCMDVLKEYIAHMQGAEILKSIGEFELRKRQSHLRLSATVVRHLEMFEGAQGGREGTLIEAVNRTQTSAGARLLKTWLAAPLLDQEELRHRQDEIEMWTGRASELKRFRQTLAQLGDVERRLGKVHSTTFNGRDLAAIAQSVLVGESLSATHPLQAKANLSGLIDGVRLARKIESTLKEELPLLVKEGGLIRQGVNPELDQLIELTQDSQKLLLELETREKEATGITSLKVRYNSVFGFYIELTKTHSHKAPSHYRRKQTLTNAERYTTDELDRLEEKVLSARSKRDQLEFEIFNGLRQEVIAFAPQLLSLARAWTRWDVLAGLAWLAIERGYKRPSFTEHLKLELCRHPVVEQTLGRGFVPNTVKLVPGECILLTGPNMAGKSTLMRQVALIAVMAQIGSYVPAEKAELPLFHEIFTRIGASDALNEGLSTFMVEMTETAQILKRVGTRSLVIMDEIGRGTSTYDGMSLAQAILEHMVGIKKPFLLFATHYHELTSLSAIHPLLHNKHMSVQERAGEIQFLHTLKDGPANQSYGIHVAKLAGLPAQVTARAQNILAGFEGTNGQLSLMPPLTPSPPPEVPAWINEVRGLDLSRMTPLDALNKLSQWQREVSS